MNGSFSKGIAFILEGSTEKVFYLCLIDYFCKTNGVPPLNKEIDSETGLPYYVLSTVTDRILIKMFDVGTITQIANSGEWFKTNCYNAFPKLEWTVFLCYDTDSHTPDITKFYQGDWENLRNSLSCCNVQSVIDLAANADIEDIMLIDSAGIFAYLALTPFALPSARKGKPIMKQIFRKKRKRIRLSRRRSSKRTD